MTGPTRTRRRRAYILDRERALEQGAQTARTCRCARPLTDRGECARCGKPTRKTTDRKDRHHG